MDYVFFDVDGTLNQTTHYALDAYRIALRKRNLNVTDEVLIQCIGMSPESIIKHLFGCLCEAEAKSWTADIKSLEYERMRQCAAAFEGVKESLDRLQTLGYHLAICSNAYLEHIVHVLEAIGLKTYFEVIGSLELGDSKSKILECLLRYNQVSSACMVGDRKFDITAAKDNNLPFIGCAYGYAPKEIRGADIVIEHPRELPAAVTALLR